MLSHLWVYLCTLIASLAYLLCGTTPPTTLPGTSLVSPCFCFGSQLCTYLPIPILSAALSWCFCCNLHATKSSRAQFCSYTYLGHSIRNGLETQKNIWDKHTTSASWLSQLVPHTFVLNPSRRGPLQISTCPMTNPSLNWLLNSQHHLPCIVVCGSITFSKVY